MNFQSKPGRYLFAAGAVASALLLRVPVWQVLGTDQAFITFFPAVAITAWVAGLWPGLLAAYLSAVGGTFILTKSTFDLRLLNTKELISLSYFLLFGSVLCGLLERAKATREEAEQKRWIRQTLTSVADGIITTDAAGRITFLNPVAEYLTGWTLGSAAGRRLSEVFSLVEEDTGVSTDDPGSRILGGRTPIEISGVLLVARDGRRIPIEDSGSPIYDDNREISGIVVVFRDITDRRLTELRVRLTEQRMAQLADAGVIGVMFGDVYGRVLEANDELLRILGRSRSELAAGGLTWTGLTPPEYQEISQRALFEAREHGKCTPFEKEYIRPDGSRVPVLIGYVLLQPERERSVAFVADLTARREAESALRRLNEELQQFTYGASHDLKEPLRMTGSYIQLLQRRYAGQLDQRAEEYIQFALSGVQRMTSILDALLQFSRAGDLSPPSTSAARPEHALQDSLESLRMSIEETGAEVTWDSLPSVFVDQTHLTQIFQNLVGNAIKFHGPDPPRVHVSGEIIDNLCRFAVRDNGLGIQPEHRERIFRAFQRMHGKSGTGLGLATSRKLIEKYGGRIWADGNGDAPGSAFFFTLPRADAP